jgi:hypothetical protein
LKLLDLDLAIHQISHRNPGRLREMLLQLSNKTVLPLPFQELLAGDNEHTPLAAGQHDIGSPAVLEESHGLSADSRDNDVILLIA